VEFEFAIAVEFAIEVIVVRAATVVFVVISWEEWFKSGTFVTQTNLR